MLVDASSVRTPEACASASLVAEFLKASRKVSDDNVRNRLGQVNCGQVVNEVYSEWRRRDSVISFCKQVSGSFSEAQSRATDSEVDRPISWLVEHARDHIEFAQTPTDPRVDAYRSKQESEPTVSASSFNWIMSEDLTESIIRDSTLRTIKDRCGLNVPSYTRK